MLIASSLALLPMAVAPSQEPPTETFAQRYAALTREYRPASMGLRDATTDLERKTVIERMGNYPSRFVALAEAAPGDPAALGVVRDAIQALGSTDSGVQIAWETNEADFPTGCWDDSAARIVALLAEHHLESGALGPVIDRMRYAYRLEFAGFLAEVLDTSPHREMRGAACLALARFLNDRQRMLQLVEDRPELARCYELAFGGDYLRDLQQLHAAGLTERIEALLERAARDYADVELFRGGTVGANAASELFELRHLGVGKIAPETRGLDQDGVTLDLEDLRGKVVLLYFWSEY